MDNKKKCRIVANILLVLFCFWLVFGIFWVFNKQNISMIIDLEEQVVRYINSGFILFFIIWLVSSLLFAKYVEKKYPEMRSSDLW